MRLALSESLKRERGLVHISKNMLSVSFQQTFLGNAVNLSRTLDSFYLIWVFQTFCLRKKMVSYYWYFDIYHGIEQLLFEQSGDSQIPGKHRQQAQTVWLVHISM